jgi:hypothetical protein
MQYMKTENARWLSGETRHKGERLLLRRQEIPNMQEVSPKFPVLVTITHALDQVTSDGLPERTYHASLAELDHTIVTAFDGVGVAVLIETFSGERNYYFYVAQNVNVSETMAAINKQHPSATLSVFSKPDPEWRFLARYAKEFF